MHGPMENSGILSLVSLSEEEKEVFLQYLYSSKDTPNFDILYNFLGEDLLRFFDVFSGETVKVPRRDEVNKIIRYIKIYQYCKTRDFTEEAIESAAKIFGRRKNSIRRLIQKVERMVEEDMYDEEGGEADSVSSGG